jgi:hypothetical protein
MENNKKEVLDFFENHIIKYVVKDLEILNTIKADANGAGGCAIPQASSTFSAIDLIGYLIHPQDIRPVVMSFIDLLKNKKYFPELSQFELINNFFESFRNNVRTVLVHRYLMTKYDVAKLDIDELFINVNGRTVFNVAFFTKISIKTIKEIYSDIANDRFVIQNNSNEESLKLVKDKLESLKSYNFEGRNNLELTGLMTSTVTFETTKSLSETKLTNHNI